MFAVWTTGVLAPYKPGVLRRERRVDPVVRPAPLVRKPLQRPGEEASPEERPAHAPRSTGAYGDTGPRRTQRQPAVVAEQIMSAPVITLPASASTDDAWRVIVEKSVRHIPIVGPDGRLAGIVSDRDLLRREFGGDGEDEPDASLGAVASDEVLSASPETTIRDIAKVMLQERLGSMPIVDDRHALVGILTRSDILRVLVNHAPIDLWV